MRISDWSSDVCSSELIAGNSGEAPRFPVVACSHDSVLAGRNEVPPHMTWGGKGLTPAQHDPRAINAPERGTKAGTQHIKRHGPKRHIVQRRVSARQIYRALVKIGRAHV